MNLLLICLIFLAVFGCNVDGNRLKNLVYREKNKDGILYLDIFKDNTFISEVKTEASVHQKYSLKIISDKNILLNSSDVGLYMIHEIKPNVWKYLAADEYDWGDRKILVVFTGNIKKGGIGDFYDQITLIGLRNKETIHLNLTGQFFRYEKFLKIMDQNTFSINNGTKVLKIKLQNNTFIEE